MMYNGKVWSLLGIFPINLAEIMFIKLLRGVRSTFLLSGIGSEKNDDQLLTFRLELFGLISVRNERIKNVWESGKRRGWKLNFRWVFMMDINGLGFE